MARSTLGDERMVSDIVQPSVHKAWYKHGHNLGDKPYAQIWRRAVWQARDQAAGGWRERKFRVINRTIEDLDREFRERTVDPRDYARIYHQRILLQAIEAVLAEHGLEEMAEVYESLRIGETWCEISTRLGQSEGALKHRFYRFRKQFRPDN